MLLQKPLNPANNCTISRYMVLLHLNAQSSSLEKFLRTSSDTEVVPEVWSKVCLATKLSLFRFKSTRKVHGQMLSSFVQVVKESTWLDFLRLECMVSFVCIYNNLTLLDIKKFQKNFSIFFFLNPFHQTK